MEKVFEFFEKLKSAGININVYVNVQTKDEVDVKTDVKIDFDKALKVVEDGLRNSPVMYKNYYNKMVDTFTCEFSKVTMHGSHPEKLELEHNKEKIRSAAKKFMVNWLGE